MALAAHRQALAFRRATFGEHHAKTGDCAAAIVALKKRFAFRRPGIGGRPPAAAPGSALHEAPSAVGAGGRLM